MQENRIDPKRDLVLERETDLAPEQIWKALTDPAEVKKWFSPRPWKVVEAKVDPRPGGIFFCKMQGPGGESHDAEPGCVLEAIPNRKLVWTSTLGPGFRPLPKSDGPGAFQITAVIEIEPSGSGSRYTATVLHADEASAKSHDDMGFQAGWGAAFDQMIEVIKGW
ncbi:MAG: polyketide cyclase [Proteobacteria bacterium]|nr:MAG: polyketide cyclase [Pseudomonadota bacterium]